MSTYVPTQSFQLAIPPTDPMTGNPVGPNVKSILRSDIPANSITVNLTTGLLYEIGDFSWTTAMAIDQIGDQLVSSGWTLTGGVYGKGAIAAPYYIGTKFGQVAMAIFVPGFGGTVIKGPILDIVALAGDIQDFFGVHNVLVSSGIDPLAGQSLYFQAVNADPMFNSPYIYSPIGQGIPAMDGFPVPAAISGSGFQYTSLPANKTSNAAGSELVVTLTENSVRSITFSFGGSYLDAISTEGTANPQYNLFLGTVGGGIVPAGVIPTGAKQPSYTVITSGYQFAIVDDNNTVDFTGAFGYGGNSILACAPFVDKTVMPNLKTSMVVVGPGMLKNQMTWNANGVSSYAVNGDYVTFQGGFLSQNGMLTFIYPSADPVLTSNNKPILINPYVQSSPGPTLEGSVTGQIWWAVVITEGDYAPGNELFLADGYKYHLISKQTVPEPCSLWMVCE